MKMNMVSLFWILGFFLISFNSNSQNIKLSRQDRKEVRKAQMAANFNILDSLLNEKSFVLEADYLSNKYGVRVPVDRSINFVMVDSLDATLQVGSAYSAGYNGVGGQTINGRITKYDYNMTGRNKDTYSIRMVFLSPVGVYDITMMINPEGYADASLRGNWSGQLNYHGRLVPLGLSKVYKGQTRY